MNVRANSGRTALIIASTYPGNLQSIRLLLAKGADPKAVDEAGDGPLGGAAGAADIAMLKELLAAGASVPEGIPRETIVHVAALHCSTVRLRIGYLEFISA